MPDKGQCWDKMLSLPSPSNEPAFILKPFQALSADIVVVGGGMAGIMAALAAKESRNRVLLIEPSNVLGGQGTAGGVAGFCGDTQKVNAPFAELIQRLSAHPGQIDPWRPNDDRRSYDLEWCAFNLQEMTVAKGVDVLLHSRVVGLETTVDTAQGEVAPFGINRLLVSTSGGTVAISPRIVIDASGGCIVPILAGLPVEHLGANRQLPMSLYFTLWDTGRAVEPVLPANCPIWRSDEEIPMTSLHFLPGGKVEVKMKVVGFDAADGGGRSDAEIFARRQMHALIYYLQTKGYQGRRLATHILAGVSRSIGIREERRIIGEHVLTEDEVRRECTFDDAVAVGTYHIDFHWPDKMQRAGTGITDQLNPYHLPLRMMIPLRALNVLVPGRGASGDQMAMSSFRVMATVAQMGFAAGKAARQFVARGLDDIRKVDMASLQRDIEKGGQSLDLSDYGAYLKSSRLTEEHIFDHKGSSLPFESCHASTIIRLRNGAFLAAWFGGVKEGTTDVSIWLAERRMGRWSVPRLLPRAVDDAHWNPVLFVSPVDGAIHLYFKTGKDPETWRTWQVISRDDGQTWGQAHLLMGGGKGESDGTPYGPVKNKPIALKSGVWLAPNSIEVRDAAGARRWDARVDRSIDNGVTWLHGPLLEVDHNAVSGPGIIQPTLWETRPGHVHMFIRSTCGYICRSDSSDGGLTWSPVQITDIPSPDSGLDAAMLEDGTLALVCNPCPPGSNLRYPLSILLSSDNGRTWTRRLDLETEPGEYSYPAIISTPTGMAITYTWHRKTIAFWHGSTERCTQAVDVLDAALS